MTDKSFEQDNVIHWIFDKIFDQLTLNASELYITPFDRIKAKTFDELSNHQLINKLSNRHIELVQQYLSNETFQQKFLFAKLKKKINIDILMDNIDHIKYLTTIGYKPDSKSLQLAVLNNRLNILEYILETNPKMKLINELLIYCAEFGHESIYFYLKEKGLTPNISVYNKAVLGNSLSIIKDISQQIGLSTKILNSAFQTNNTEIILFLVNEAINDKINITPNLITYPILNNNFELLLELEKLNLINYHEELYYSAILSGSIPMMTYIESKLPNIHDEYVLDTGRTKKGQSSLLLEDMIYSRDHKKYFSHTINYAIQSNSLEVLKYIHAKGYGITSSNILTAIKQGTLEILQFLLEQYHQPLGSYFIHYFGTNCHLPDKISKAKLLLDSGLLSLDPVHKMTTNDYKKESVHLEMIGQTLQVPEDGKIDADYLMKYQMFFVPVKGYKLNYRLLTKTRICLEVGLEEKLLEIFSMEHNMIDKYFLIDCLYLFGTIQQVKQLYPLLNADIAPSPQIIMETLCYCQIGKLCYLLNKNLLNEELLKQIYPVIIMLADSSLNLILNKIRDVIGEEFQLKFILQSGKKSLINDWINKYENIFLSKDIIKNLLMMDDVELIKKVNFDKKYLAELIDFAEESDLFEVRNYLQSIAVQVEC